MVSVRGNIIVFRVVKILSFLDERDGTYRFAWILLCTYMLRVCLCLMANWGLSREDSYVLSEVINKSTIHAACLFTCIFSLFFFCRFLLLDKNLPFLPFFLCFIFPMLL